MRYAFLLLVACGAAPNVATSVVVRGLDAATVKSVELFIVQPAPGATLTCESLLATGVFSDQVVLRDSAVVSVTESAKLSALDPGTYFAVGYAYGSADATGMQVGQGCAQSDPVTPGVVTKLTLVLR